MATLKTFNLYNPEQPCEGDVPAPSPEKAKEILAEKLTLDQLEIINGMEKPTFQLIPVTSMTRYEEALNSYKPMEKQQNAHIFDPYIFDWRKKAFEITDERDGVTGNTIIGWRIAVREGVKKPKLPEGDDVTKKRKERDAWFSREFGEKGISGCDFKGMFLLMMESLKNGEPIKGIWTFINEEPEINGYASAVGWDEYFHRVCLYGFNADAPADYACFRTSVVVDIPRFAI